MYGQLGDGSTTNRNIPTKVSISNVKSVSVGDGHTCAIKNDDTLYCWGQNTRSQLGDGTTTDINQRIYREYQMLNKYQRVHLIHAQLKMTIHYIAGDPMFKVNWATDQQSGELAQRLYREYQMSNKYQRVMVTHAQLKMTIHYIVGVIIIEVSWAWAGLTQPAKLVHSMFHHYQMSKK